jgi:BirA family biotin operon repressor/biotin-[acetyl-CoA-carboxylase] ligase
MIQTFTSERISAARQMTGRPTAIEIVEETGSTNADLMQRIEKLSLPTLRVALAQTAGRGRNGRSWHSAPGASLTFSLAWRFSRTAREMAGLPLAMGVAVAQTLGRLGVMVRLKWPNDVMKNGMKLAGILIEMPAKNQNEDKNGRWAVIGIGLNLTMPDSLETLIGQPAGDAPWLARMDRNVLMAALLDDLSNAMILFDNEGFSPFMQCWNELHAHAGREVVIIDRGQSLLSGVAAGIDPEGRLLLDCAAGRIAISAGDVSLRAISGQSTCCC